MIGVLVSGLGTNLQAIIDAELPIAGVISSKPGVQALERAERAGIANAVFRLEDFPKPADSRWPDGFTSPRGAGES